MFITHGHVYKEMRGGAHTHTHSSDYERRIMQRSEKRAFEVYAACCAHIRQLEKSLCNATNACRLSLDVALTLSHAHTHTPNRTSRLHSKNGENDE